jgi:hypothetical protein
MDTKDPKALDKKPVVVALPHSDADAGGRGL